MVDRADILAEGQWGLVAFARRKNGNCPAAVFLEELEKRDLIKCGAIFQYLADHGQLLNKEKFRPLDDGIFEIKVKTHRILCFQKGHVWYLTHGFSGKHGKGPGRAPKTEIEKAQRIRNEHIAQSRP